MLGSSLAVWSRDIGNDLAFQLVRANSTELEMVRAQNRITEFEKFLANFSEHEQKAIKDLKKKSNDVARLEAEVVEVKKKKRNPCQEEGHLGFQIFR